MSIILYWIYLWQLKEYRWDRLRLYLKQFDIWGLISQWLIGNNSKPRLTIKAGLIFGLGVGLMGVSILFLLSLSLNWLIALVLVYFNVPILVSLAVGLVTIPKILIEELLFRLARRKRNGFQSLIVIGITGSYGKSTTKEYIKIALQQQYHVLATAGSVNTPLGVSLQILRSLTAHYDFYIVEMGAYHPGEIRKMVNLVQPKYAVLTGINSQHLGLFGSIESIIATKFELIEGIPDNGVVFANIADEIIAQEIQKINKKVIPYSALEPQGNIQAAIEVAKYVGFNADETSRINWDLFPLVGRQQVLPGKKNCVIINDTFSSNPTGFIAALELMKQQDSRQKILITTGIYELGARAAEINRLMHDCAAQLCTKMLLVESIHQEFYPQARLVTKYEDLMNEIEDNINNQTTFLFEGRNRLLVQLLDELVVKSENE